MPNSDKTRALANLAGAVSHELNNIFTAVAGNLSVLEDQLDKNDSNAGVINDVIRTVRRGMELSEKLQAFAGHQPLHRARIDLNETVIRTITHLKVSVLKQVDVHLELMRGRCDVIVDQKKLARLLEEMARNAAVAMEYSGTFTISSEVSMLKSHEIGQLPAGQYIKLTLRDRGKGMTPDVTARAIEPFFSTQTGPKAEIGWGLSKAVGFLRQCGGTMVIASVHGLGTAIDIYLPKIPE